MEWFFALVLNWKTNDSSCDPKATWEVDTDLCCPPTLFFSKWEAIKKPLAACLFWTRSILCHQWWIWYWYSFLDLKHQAGTNHTCHKCCSGMTHFCTILLGKDRHTKLDKYGKLSPSVRHDQCIIGLWFVWSLKLRKQPHWFSWHWDALSIKEKFYYLFWLASTKPLKDLKLLFKEQEQNTFYQCLQIVWFVRFSSSLILINFFIYLKATQIAQFSGWLVSRDCKHWTYKYFDPFYFQSNFHPLPINEECANKLLVSTASSDTCRPDELK